jgi:glutamine cyclotransferase
MRNITILMKKYIIGAFILSSGFISQSCKKDVEPPKQNPPQIATVPASVYSYEVVNTYPHDTGAFTQGLEYYNGELYESTGLNGKSSLRRVELTTGKVLQKIDIDKQYFGEGMTIFGGKIYMITYQTHVGFIYDLKTFKQIGSWQYEGEGWGLTNDGTNIIMSNGTNKINYLDPQTLTIVKTLEVTDENYLVERLNELEYIGGEIYANIWTTDRVARIDPATGKVNSWVDLSGLLSPQERTERVDVLNGIAYDKKGDRIFVTGKLWPKLFEIKIKKKGLAMR